MKSFITLLEEKTQSIKGKVYISHSDNRKYFNQKASTQKNNFCYKQTSITLVPDSSETYEHGNYGIAKLFGVKVYVTSVDGLAGKDWEIEGLVK